MVQENMQRIGWVGVGRMGYPMAERLVRAGHEIEVWNRSAAVEFVGLANSFHLVGGLLLAALIPITLHIRRSPAFRD